MQLKDPRNRSGGGRLALRPSSVSSCPKSFGSGAADGAGLPGRD